MRFVWTNRNVEHVTAHGLSAEEVEAVFGAPDPAEEGAMRTKKKKPYATLVELEKNFEQEAAWADSRYGANVARLTKPGRPRKGTKTERTEPHSVRVAGLVWRSLQKKAKARGLSTNAALQLAAMEWVSKER